MGLLTSRLSGLRNDPRLLKLPPYLALLCIFGGILWMTLLPLDEYSRRTYVSENALLPGQVHTYFAGSEQNIFRAYRHEVTAVLEPKPINDDQGNPTGQYLVATEDHRNAKFESILHDAGIKTARQQYKYTASGKTFQGENLYAVIHGPRADGTESIVLIAPVRNTEDQLNIMGVTLIITLARYFSRWSLWSKDIIILITPDSSAGPQAFVDAYHSMHDPSVVADLSLKSGHIQGAVVIDYPFDHRFETLHVAYDGINGQLPNLDLINTAVIIASGQMGIQTTIQNQHTFAVHADHGKYMVRLQTLARGMLQQALGKSTGAHSVFMPYHIDAITLTAIGDGWQDEMAFGRVVESLTRSINNLLEKLHQSFFFYLLLQNQRFVSIGTYLPSAMAIGASFTIVAIFAWVKSGYKAVPGMAITKGKHDQTYDSKASEEVSLGTTMEWKPIDRPLTAPVALLAAIHLTSMLSVYFFADVHLDKLVSTTAARSLAVMLLPFALALGLKQGAHNAVSPASTTARERTERFNIFLQSLSLSLLILGLEVTALGTFKFSLSMLLGLLLPFALAFGLRRGVYSAAGPASTTAHEKSQQFYTILKSLSLLILGLEVTVLATLNFSLSMFLGLLCAPLAFIEYKAATNAMSTVQAIGSLVTLIVLSPPVTTILVSALEIYYLASYRAPIGIIGRVREYLETEAVTFTILGGWGIRIGVWCVWVPAWIVGTSSVAASFLAISSSDSDIDSVIHNGMNLPDETSKIVSDSSSHSGSSGHDISTNKPITRIEKEKENEKERERSRSGSRRRRLRKEKSTLSLSTSPLPSSVARTQIG